MHISPPKVSRLFLASSLIFALLLNALSIPFVSANSSFSVAADEQKTAAINFDTQLAQEITKNAGADAFVPSNSEKNVITIESNIQRLHGQISSQGLNVESTLKDKEDNFSIAPTHLTRDGKGAEKIQLNSKSAPVIGDDQAVYHDRGAIIEKVRSTQDGLVHDFIVPKKIGGKGELTLVMNLSGANIDKVSEEMIYFTTHKAKRDLVYSKLFVTDANDKEVPAVFTAIDVNNFSVKIDDRNATYPLYIDPTITNEDWEQVGANNGANAEVKALAMDSEGNLYAGGYFTAAGGGAASYIAMWDGTTWSALGDGVSAGTDVTGVMTIAIDSSDNVYVGGDFQTAGSTPASYIAMWDPVAEEWSALDGGTNWFVASIVIDSVDNVYVGGFFTTVDGMNIAAKSVAMWDGADWSAMGDPITSDPAVVYSMALDSSENLYVGGTFYDSGFKQVAMWDGAAWNALDDTGFDNAITAVALDSADNLYVGGQFNCLFIDGDDGDGMIACTTGVEELAASHVAMWDGADWNALGDGVGSEGEVVYAIEVDSEDNVYVAGDFRTSGMLEMNRIAMWDGDEWIGFGDGIGGASYPLPFVRALLIDSEDNVYVGGSFTNAGENWNGNLAKLENGDWADEFLLTGDFLSGTALAIAVDPNDNVYVGGEFLGAGSQIVNRVAQWNGEDWLPVGSGVDGNINAMVSDSQGNIYMTGTMEAQGNGITMWDPIAEDYFELGMGLSGEGLSVDVDSQDNVYVGGSFTSAYPAEGGDIEVNYIAKWDPSAGDVGEWSAMGNGADNTVRAVVVDDSDNVWVGGSFTEIDSVPASRVAVWSGSSWEALGDGVGGTVYALAVTPTSDLYAGGSFTTAGGEAAARIAKWSPFESEWETLGAGVNGRVNTLALDSEGNLFAGGEFTTAGEGDANHIAFWDPILEEWGALGDGVNSVVRDIAIDSFDAVYVAGSFYTSGEDATSYFSFIQGTPDAPVIEFLDATATTIGVYWNEVDGADHYIVTSNADDDVTTEDAFYIYEGLTPNSEYTWQVKTVAGNGNESDFSEEASGYTDPAAPSSVNAAANSTSSVTVSWGANGNPGGTSYQVVNVATESVVATTTSTSATINDLSASTGYTFFVRALPLGDSEAVGVSSNVSVTTNSPSSGGGGGGGGGTVILPNNPNNSNNTNTETESEGENEGENSGESTPEETTSESGFVDTVGHWAESYVDKLAELGIVQGKSDTTFAPEDKVTRAELLKMIIEAVDANLQTATVKPFSDVELNAWYVNYVYTGKQLGFITGYSDGTFRPESTVNRAEALAIILKSSGLDLAFDDASSFPDTSNEAWYADLISFAVENGIISGYQNGDFGPGDKLTRAQAAKIIVLVMELL